MSRKKLVRPTKQMKKLMKLVSSGMTIKDAGIAAGYGKPQSSHRAYKLIKLRFHPALEAAGFDVDQELIEIYSKLKEKMECRETIWGQSGGIFMDKKTVIPHDIQLRAANDAGRFLGVIGNGHDPADRAEDVRVPAVSVTVVLNRTGDATRIVEERPASSPDNQQSTLDVSSYEDGGLSGSDPSV
jgi:hypothetical protein